MASHLKYIALNLNAILLCSTPWKVHALIDITPKSLDVKKNISIVRIINIGDNPEFVEVQLSQVENPGVAPDKEKRIPLGLLNEPSIYAAPFKLSLGPRQEKVVQLFSLYTPKNEIVYRLSVFPRQNINFNGSKKNLLLVSFSYEGLIRHLPQIQVDKWDSKCIGPQIKIEATGNVRSSFKNVRINGKNTDDFNVYPGTPIIFNVTEMSGLNDEKKFQIKC